VDDHSRHLVARGHLRHRLGLQVGHEIAGGRGEPEEHLHRAVIADRDLVDDAHVDESHRPAGGDAARVPDAIQRGQNLVTERILR
jgi:hypothetical protein